jgi:hypothetical protein
LYQPIEINIFNGLAPQPECQKCAKSSLEDVELNVYKIILECQVVLWGGFASRLIRMRLIAMSRKVSPVSGNRS